MPACRTCGRVINTIVCDVTALSRPSQVIADGSESVAGFQECGDIPVGRVWRVRWPESECASSSERFVWFGQKGIHKDAASKPPHRLHRLFFGRLSSLCSGVQPQSFLSPSTHTVDIRFDSIAYFDLRKSHRAGADGNVQ
jgi:hypothetical protein